MTRTWIPYARQSIDQSDVDAVVSALWSSNLTQGPRVEAFEDTVAGYCGVKYAVSTSSATAALHIAALAAGLRVGDQHWTVPNTFVASANCGLYCGSKVDFVDIDPVTFNMSPELLEEKLRDAAKVGRVPKLIIPVHFAGQSAPMEKIYSIARHYGVTVIEDASHAIGGEYQGRKIGGCQFADMTVFSFHPVKIVTSGEGGMVLTNDADLYQKLKRLRSHGITRDEQFLTKPPEGPWSYEQLDLGFNYRLTDLQAALGVSQMQRLDAFISRREELVGRYHTGLSGLHGVQLPTLHSDAKSAWHLYVLQVAFSEINISRKDVFIELKKRNIGVNVHYLPVHLQPFYRQLGFEPGQFPNAEAFYKKAISIPLYFDLTNLEQDYVITQLREVIGSECT